MKKLLSLTFVVSLVPGIISGVAVAQDDEKAKSTSKDEKKESTPKELIPVDPAQIKRAKETLQSAREKLIDHKSVRANIVETVAIGERRFRATGSYLQGTDLRLKLEYTIKVGKTDGYMLQICDGEILWTHQKVGKIQTVTRRNVREILNAAASNADIAQNLLIAELGLGGLPALLAALERTMDFDTARDETIDGNAFVVIEGTWKSKFSKHWADRNPNNPGTFPEFVPDRVRIFFDKKNLFPHRVLYLKKPPKKRIFRKMVALDFTKVVLNAATNADDFEFASPKGVQEQDITQFYLQQLTLAREAGKKPAADDKKTKTDATKGEK